MRHFFLFLLPLIFSCGQKKAKDVVTVGGVKTKPIPGLTAALVHDNFTKSGFKLDKTMDGDISVWTSTENNEMHEFKVMTNSAADKVISVQASVVSMLTLDQAAMDFMGKVASVQYKYADPQKAKDWVMANVDKGGSTTIGDVNFQVTVNNETSRNLKIYAE